MADVCPACGGDLYVAGYGCPECGHARPPRDTRKAGPIAAAVGVGVVAIGALLLFTLGTVSKHVAWAHVMLFAMSAIFGGGGAYALMRPKGLRLASNEGTDAHGMQRFGPTHASTTKEGRVLGAIMLAVAIAMMLLGAFFGAAV